MVETLSVEEMRKNGVLRRLELAHLIVEMDKIASKTGVQEQICKRAQALLKQLDQTAEEVAGLWAEFKETLRVAQKEVA